MKGKNMNNLTYIGRNHKKFETVLNYYAARMYKTIFQPDEVYALETMEHLRKPPVSGLEKIEPGKKWGVEYGNMWLCCDITVPNEADGKTLCAIPEANAVEILCFRNGIPAGIINSKNRFLGGEHSAMFISKSAKAGEKISLAFECYAGHTCFGCAPYESYMRDESKTEDFTKVYSGIRIVVLDDVICKFVFDLATVLQLAKLPGENYAAMKVTAS